MNADDSNAKRFHVGSTIAGRYRVERPIGEGAMGAVALARHVTLGETVAIKFLPPELRRDPVANARLSREAKALARIKSDHVARVLDVGATLSVGPYMVMEYLEGTDLGEVLETEGPLPPARAVECVLQVCEALTVAHTAGITHRDIKPQNLFLARHGRFETLKILDFGIAEDAAPARDASADETSADEKVEVEAAARALAPVYGTPSYMAPERVRNDPDADHRSDIWSVGVVLHELVTGRAVFDASSITETCARIVSDEPIPLERNSAVLPPSLRSIIARCLERDPARRYQCVEELAAALAPLATMHERFRGRSTGAFSRHLIEEEFAQYVNHRARAPTPAPPWPALAEAFRGALARLRQRSASTYLVIAAASVLVVALGSRLFGDVRWMTPPPKVAVPIRVEPEPNAHSEPLRERSAVTPRSLVESVLPLGAASSSEVGPGPAGSEPVHSSAEAAALPGATPADAVLNRRPPSSTTARAPRASRRSEAAASRERGASEGASRIGRPRARLVQERPATKPAGKSAPDAPSVRAARAATSSADTPAAKPGESTSAREPAKAVRPKKSRPLPAWLQTYEPKSP